MTDQLAVGTPLAMDIYASPYDEATVDTLPVFTEEYITLHLQKNFFFSGSAGSGRGAYGGGVSGGFDSGVSFMPCSFRNSTMSSFSKLKRAIWPAANEAPQVCRDESAPFVSYHF